MRNSVTKRIALSGLFLALALIVSLIENLIPPVIPALPYAKLGLGNVVLLACFLLVGVGEGCVVLVLKCFFAALFSGNLSALIWSLPAAAVAYAAMVILSRTRLFSVTGLSVAGGMLHNMTQILVSMARRRGDRRHLPLCRCLRGAQLPHPPPPRRLPPPASHFG